MKLLDLLRGNEWPRVQSLMRLALALAVLLGLVAADIALVYVIGHVWSWGNQFNHWVQHL